MNKQELIDKLKRDLTAMSEIKWKKYEYDKGYERAIKEHLAMIAALDRPKKPVVPQFVADWYEENKDNFEFNVQCLCVHNCEPVREIDTWFDSDYTKPIETLVMMHKFGYEVEKKQLYTVEIPNPNLNAHTVLQKTDNGIVLIWVTHSRWRGWENSKLTESEIKQDFGWAWQFAEEVEDDTKI